MKSLWPQKYKIMPFAETWMDLEILILTEVIQTERQIACDITYMRNPKKAYKWTYLQNWNRVTDKLMVVGKGGIWASQVVLVVKNLPTKAGDGKWRGFDLWVGKVFLAWRISWTEEFGRLQSMGLQRDRHDRSDLIHVHTQEGYKLEEWLDTYTLLYVKQN